ncbi:hypothetical protein DPMN_020677 [Dreissena polymorpha]|uniref:Uncharacterized protein n=1 Tax=Dreissena polymorpha TaxID=45954 RepID=A0A9D4NLG7_DREPO|nr:hypothetical protein DPMN_020677 [Dreissena polymorpha]
MYISNVHVNELRRCGTLRARQDTKEIVDVHYIRLCLKPSRPCSSTNCENLPHSNLSHHTSHSAIINLAPSIRTTSAVATGERRTGRCGHTGSRGLGYCSSGNALLTYRYEEMARKGVIKIARSNLPKTAYRGWKGALHQQSEQKENK